MRKIIFLLLLLVCAATGSIYAQKELSDSHVSGHIISKQTGEHLPYVTILVKGSNLYVMSDATGHFFLRNLHPGKYTLEASGIGYIPKQMEVNIEPRKTLEVSFELADDVMELEQVVVSGSRSETTRRNSPSLVNVLNNKIFDAAAATCLADGLSYQPGVRVEDNCQNCGFTQVRINGLDGHYSQILMDSRPVYSALTGVYGLEQIPANMIDRVEVVRGGGSALFGSSAIGGTVNIITRDPSFNSAEFTHTLTSLGISGALDNNTTLNASLVTDNNRAGLFIYGQNRDRDGYDYDGDGYTEITSLKSKTIGMRSFLKTGNNSKLSLQYHGTSEFRRGGDLLDRPPHQANIAEQTNHSIHGGGVSYDLFSTDYSNRLNVFSSFQHTKRDSYYGGGQDPDAYGNTKDIVVVSGAQYTRKMDKFWFMPAELVAGVEHNYNNLVDESLGYDHFVNQTVNTFSTYLQNEWRTNKWGFLIGGRLDKHNLIKNVIFSPRVNVRFNPSRSVNLRATYSTGFRAPQAFDEDFHVAVVGGERIVTILADNLKQESSQSVSLSADLYRAFGKVQTNLLIEGFYTNLKDVFAIRKLGFQDEKGNEVQERYNGSGAEVMGINIEGKAMLSSKLQVQAGITLQKSRYKEAEKWSDDPDVPAEKRMFRSPDSYGYLTGTYNPIKQLSASLTGTYTGKMLVQHMKGSGTDWDIAVITPVFFDMNLKVGYDFKIFNAVNLQVNGGIQNLFNAYQRDFDTGANRDSGYVYGPSLPRSLFAGIKLGF